MKFNQNDIQELLKKDGGRFACKDIKDAYKFCRQLALSHYENFPVASLLLPKKMRQHIFPIYAFARMADDIADEGLFYSKTDQLDALDNMVLLLQLENYSNPIFFALNHSRRELKIEIKPFLDLIKAFKMDVDFKQANDFNELLYYCKYSANPIGELILKLSGQFNEKNKEYSDNICTALQLANFWQDLSNDIPNKRFYIPKDFLEKYNLDINNLHKPKNSIIFIECINELYDLTNQLFDKGKPLIKHLKPFRIKLEIALTLHGGFLILKKTRKLGFSIIRKRPKLRKLDFFTLFFKSLF